MKPKKKENKFDFIKQQINMINSHKSLEKKREDNNRVQVVKPFSFNPRLSHKLNAIMKDLL